MDILTSDRPRWLFECPSVGLSGCLSDIWLEQKASKLRIDALMHGSRQLTFGRDRLGKYSVADRSIICQRRSLRPIFDLRDTGKSRYFTLTLCNNCFIAWSQSLFSHSNHSKSLKAAIFSQKWERDFNYAWIEYYLQQNTFTHDRTII